MPISRLLTRGACVAVLSASFIHGAAQADTDVQSWNAIALAGEIHQGSPWQFWFDGHYRMQDDASELGVHIFRPAVGYKVSDLLTFWLGYARVTINGGQQDINEDRIWQQATYPLARVLGGELTGRTRVEQRFRDDIAGDTGHRLRQFVRWSRPISENWSMVVWDELFVGVNDADWGQQSGFDQNRFYVGPTWHANENWRVEVGYMHNYINPPGTEAASRTNHNLAVTVFGTW